MDYVTLGQSDLKVSRIGFGCAQLGGVDYGAVDPAALKAAVHRALDLGVTFFDTADVYGLGLSEERLAQALGKKARDLVVATKFGVAWNREIDEDRASTFIDANPRRIAEALDASLKRLKLDCIPLYQLHWPDPAVPFGDVLDALLRLRQRGKIRHIGICNFSAIDLRTVGRWEDVVACQESVSLADPHLQVDLVPALHDTDISVIAYGTLAHGLLTGKYDERSRFASNDLRSRHPAYKGDALKRNLSQVGKVKGVAKRLGKTPAQVAIRWVLQRPRIASALVGAKNVKQLEENVGALGWSLSTEDMNLLAGDLPIVTPRKPAAKPTYAVPFVDPREHYRRYKTEFDSAITDCLEKGDLIARKQLRDFEASLAKFVGTKYAVGLNSGYHALALSLLAAGVGKGDEVITVAHTFVATVSAIVHCGATPVLVDVGPDHNLDPDALEKAITKKTRAILPVHLNGRVCDMDRIMAIAKKRKLLVIEDACQSIGATFKGRMAGSFGLAGCWSFYPFKMLGCFGDGGAITTDDADLARAVTRMRFNGEDRETGEYHFHGYTALLDNIQAAVLDAKLKHLPEWIEHRRRIADLYRKELKGVGDLKLPHFEGPHADVYQNYVVRTKRRDAVREHLKSAGIETLVSWPKPMWDHKALKLGKHKLPVTEALCREVISLPMSAETTGEQVKRVGEAIRDFFAEETTVR